MLKYLLQMLVPKAAGAQASIHMEIFQLMQTAADQGLLPRYRGLPAMNQTNIKTNSSGCVFFKQKPPREIAKTKMVIVWAMCNIACSDCECEHAHHQTFQAHNMPCYLDDIGDASGARTDGLAAKALVKLQELLMTALPSSISNE